MDTQTAFLVSTAEVWISEPDTQTPIFLGFLSGRRIGNTAVGRGFVNSFFFPNFGYFPSRKIAKFTLNFWPVRVHEKPSFRYVPSTFFANFNNGFREIPDGERERPKHDDDN